MNIIRPLISIVLCLSLLVCFAACGKKEENNKADSDNAPENKYTEKWVIEPSIEADAIYTLPLCVFNEETNHYDITYGDVFIIEKDGKSGFINSNGDIIVEPKYDTIETCICKEGYIVSIKPEGSYRTTYTVDSSFNEIWSYPHSCEEFDGYEYLWDAAANKVMVKKVNSQRSSDAYLPEAVKLDNGKYAVASNGKLCSNADYDAAGIFTGGLVALSKGGKWGYVNSEGKQIIPFEYDAVPGYSATGNGNTPYECSENYVTVFKNGKYGVVKSDGTQVIPCQYTALTTVHDGRVFASNDGGVWGLLLVDESISNGIASDTKVTEPTEKSSESSVEETTESTQEQTSEQLQTVI